MQLAPQLVLALVVQVGLTVDLYEQPSNEIHEVFNAELQSGWEISVGDKDQPALRPSFWQDDTFVYLQGALQGGSAGPLFTLPYGFRPRNTVTFVTTTGPLNDNSFTLVYDNANTTTTRWEVPDEGDAELGTNHGAGFTLPECQATCTSLRPDCSGIFWGDNRAWGGIDLCITLGELRTAQVGAAVGYSFKKNTEELGTVLLSVAPTGLVSVGTLGGEATLSLRGRFPYVRTTSCSATGSFDSTGDMEYRTYDIERPVKYECSDVDTSSGKYTDVEPAPGATVLSEHNPLQAYVESETGYVHLRGALTVPCCDVPLGVGCAFQLCTVSDAIPIPDWGVLGKSANFAQMEEYNADALHVGRFLVVFANGTAMVSSGTQSQVYFDGIVLVPFTEEAIGERHVGSSVEVLTSEVFWSFHSKQSPIRAVKDYHGVTCLAGGLGFRSVDIDDRLVVTLAQQYRPTYRTKHPIACALLQTESTPIARQCVVYVNPDGTVRLRVEEDNIVSGNEDVGHWISLEGVCFGGYSINVEIVLDGQSEVELQGQAVVRLS